MIGYQEILLCGIDGASLGTISRESGQGSLPRETSSRAPIPNIGWNKRVKVIKCSVECRFSKVEIAPQLRLGSANSQ